MSWHKSCGRRDTEDGSILSDASDTSGQRQTMSAPQLNAVRALPPRLIRFFQRYPPPALFPNLTSTSPVSPSASPAPASPPNAASTISHIPPSDPNASVTETSVPELPSIPSTAPRNSRIPAHAHDLPYPNPFLPTKNFTTGRWHGPAFGLRKQADLVKLAVQHDVVDLLPWTIKKPGEKEARRIESGLMVKGTGEGQKVKGKSWERTLKGRLEMRRQAMLNMPQMIQEWKQVSHRSPREAHQPLANTRLERPWSRMEEVAKWAGEEIIHHNLKICHAFEHVRRGAWPCCVQLCLQSRRHLGAGVLGISFSHCSILGRCVHRILSLWTWLYIAIYASGVWVSYLASVFNATPNQTLSCQNTLPPSSLCLEIT
jgi:large subunit ribosomal protein L25